MVLVLNLWSQKPFKVSHTTRFLRTVRWLKPSTRTRSPQLMAFDRIRMIRVCSLRAREKMSSTAWLIGVRQGSKHTQTIIRTIGRSKVAHLRTLWGHSRRRRLRWKRDCSSMIHLLRGRHQEMRKEHHRDCYSKAMIAVSIKAQWLRELQKGSKRGIWVSSQSFESRRCPLLFQTITTSRSSVHSKPTAKVANPTLINKRSKRKTLKRATSTRTRFVGVQT